MLLGELIQEAVERRCILARQDREHVARLGEEALGHGPHHLGEALAGDDRALVEEAEEITLARRDALDRGVARGDGDLAGDEPRERALHLPRVLVSRAL